MDSAAQYQWSDPNAGHVIYEDQERYRAVVRRSLLSAARHCVAAAHRASDERAAEASSHESSVLVSGKSRGVLSVAAQQRDGLARELASMQSENQRLSRHVEDLQATLRENNLIASKTMRSQDERAYEELLRSAQARVAELAALVEAKDADLTRAEELIAEANVQREDVSRQLAVTAADHAATEEQLLVAESECAKLKQALHESERHTMDLGDDVAALSYELDEKNSKVDELQSVVLQLESVRSELMTRDSELAARASEVEGERDEYAAKLALASQDLAAQRQSLENRESELQEHKSALSELSAQHEQLSRDHENAQREIARLREEQSAAQQRQHDLDTSLQRASTELDALRETEAQLKAESESHAATKEALAKSVSEGAELKTAVAELQKSHGAVTQELARVTEQLHEAARSADQTRVAMASESKKLLLQQKLIAELESENDELRTKRNAAANTFHEEHHRLVALEKENAEMKNRCRAMEACQQENERAIKKLTAEAKQLFEERLELAQGFEREVSERGALQEKLQDAKFKETCLLSEIKQQNQNLVDHITAHSSELRAAQDQAAALEQELNHVLKMQTQHVSDVQGIEVLRADLGQLDSQLKHERQRTRRLQNQIQDLKGNIRVVVRVRPSVSSELSNVRLTSDCVMLTGVQNTCTGAREVAKTYQFDRVFGPDASNQAVCEETEYLVQSALGGHNVCIFAYGQTGSGKTWTMGSSDGVSVSAMDTVMDAVARSREKTSFFEYTVVAESVEIYNEQFRDLLDDSPMLTGPVTGIITGPVSRYGRPSVTGALRDSCGVALKMNERTRLPELVGTTKAVVESAAHARELLAKAARARSVAATAANARSSRSHFVFIAHIERRNKHATNSEVQHGVLNLVDLAGSERLAHSKTTGDRLVETTAINSSLSTLGTVIKALANREPSRVGERTRPVEHLTYRDSKLTFLLQGSLSGNSKAMLLATLSPEADHANETRSTLQFAETASRATVARH